MIVKAVLLPILLSLGGLSTTALAVPIGREERRRDDEGSAALSSAVSFIQHLPSSVLLLAPSGYLPSPGPTPTPLSGSDDPTSPSSVPGTLVFSNPFALLQPSSLSADNSDATPSPSPTQAAKSTAPEDPFPPTTRDGVIASSLVGAIVALGLMTVVWCLVRAHVQRRRLVRERTIEDEKERAAEEARGREEADRESKFVIGSEDGSSFISAEEEEGDVEVLEDKKTTEDGEVDVVGNVARLSKHLERDLTLADLQHTRHDSSASSSSLASNNTATPASVSASASASASNTLASTTTTSSSSSSCPLPSPPTPPSPSERDRLRTTTTDTTASIDSYYTSPAVSPAPSAMMDVLGWVGGGGAGSPRPGTTESNVGRAL